MRTLSILLLSNLLLTAAAAFAAETITENAIPYTSIPHGKLAFDLVRPAAPGRYPAILLIHGGGFSGGKREDLLPLANRLAQQGFVAITADYRLTPLYQFPLPLYDLKAAVRFARANAAKYSIDADHFAAIGFSAGATFAQFLAITRNMPQFEGAGGNATQSSAVDCAISEYGRSDMRLAYEGSRNAATVLPALLGGDRNSALPAHFRGSPLNWITPDSAPILAIHGTRDGNVPFEQSTILIDRLRSMGVEAELETIAEAGHGFRGADEERAFLRALNFLNRKLKPAQLESRRLMVNDHGAGKEILCVSWPSGKVLWRRPNGGATEVAVLPNGNVLYIEDPKGTVTEIDAEQKPIWQYKTSGVNIVSIQRLANGNTLLVDDLAPKIFEVNPTGETVASILKPEYRGLAMRRARRTATGTTLVAVQMAGLLLELDSTGKVLHKWNFPERRPALAIPQPDGGMLVGLSGPGEIRRVDAQGKTTMTFAGDNDKARMAWPSGFTQLPNGGIIASDYMGARIVEFDAEGNVVNQLQNIPWSVTSVALLK